MTSTAFTGARRGAILPALLPPVALFGALMLVGGIIVAATGMDALHWWPLTFSLWMAVFQVPFTGIGPTGFVTVVGFLPLLPTLLYMAALVWVTRRFTTDDSPADTQLFSFVALLTPLVLAGIGWGSMWGFREVVFIQPPQPARMVALILLTTAVSVVVGLRGRVLHLIPHAKASFPAWGKAGFRVAAQFLLVMLTVGAVASVSALIAHWSLIGEVLLYGNSAAGIMGFALFSMLYLPNMMVAAAIVLAGGGIQVGVSQASLYATHLEQLPAFPLFAALPQREAQLWWLMFLAIPALAAIVVAYRTPGRTVGERLRAIAFAVPTTAAFTAVGAWFAGGEIGVMGGVRMSEGVTGLILAAWIGVLGAVTVFLQRGAGFAAVRAGLAERRAAQRSARQNVTEGTTEDATDTAGVGSTAGAQNAAGVENSEDAAAAEGAATGTDTSVAPSDTSPANQPATDLSTPAPVDGASATGAADNASQ